jgi:hypothetical protein
MADLGNVLTAATNYGNDREDEARAEFTSELNRRQSVIDQLTSNIAAAQLIITSLDAQREELGTLLDQANANTKAARDECDDAIEQLIASRNRETELRMEIARLELLLNPAPDPMPGYELLHDFDFSSEPAGVVYSSGVATNNKATRRKAQVAYGQGADGTSMRIRGEIVGGVLYSADVKFQGQRIPPLHHQVCEWSGGVGDACWPAPGWLRPLGGGEGEIDPLEYFDKSGNTAGTLHKTPYTKGVHKHIGKRFAVTAAQLAVGRHVSEFRMESAKASFWLDGALVATITKAEFESACGVGTWATQMIGHDWYSRDTLQIGPGTVVDQTGPMPATFAPMDFYIHSRRVYVPA